MAWVFSLSFMDLSICVCHEIWKILGHYFFKNFCFILYSFEISITHVLDSLMSNKLLAVLFFPAPPPIIFSLCISVSLYSLSLSSLILSSTLWVVWWAINGILRIYDCVSFLALLFDSYSFHFSGNSITYLILHVFHLSLSV